MLFFNTKISGTDLSYYAVVSISIFYFSDLLGLVPYLDWFVIMVTVATCIVMIIQEKASYKRVDDPFKNDQLLMVTECIFFGSMACELFLKVTVKLSVLILQCFFFQCNYLLG